MNDTIQIKGARENNLKNVDLTIPRDKLVVFTGLSGSGKSSLAFDTIYAEGQRRYVESLSSYARQFLGQMDKPDVDSIDGLSPAISIDQKSTNRNPRSTVGTVTEIYDYYRLLFARIGQPHCPKCGQAIKEQSSDQIINTILSWPEGTKIQILAPVIRGKKGEHQKIIDDAISLGEVRATSMDSLQKTVCKTIFDIEDDETIDKLTNYINKQRKDQFIWGYIAGADNTVRNNYSRETIAPQNVIKNEYVKNKDFAFIFRFYDNDFGGFVEQAAERFCELYESMLFDINNYPSNDEYYTSKLERFEDPENIVNIFKTLIKSYYLEGRIDHIHKTFNYETDDSEATRIVDYLDIKRENFIIGTCEEIDTYINENFMCEVLKDELNNGEPYIWDNGETLVVKIKDYKATYKTI